MRPMELIDFKKLRLPKRTVPVSKDSWYFWGYTPMLPMEVCKVSLDTGAMAVSVSTAYASKVVRAQDQAYAEGKGNLEGVCLSSLERMEEQRFSGFTNASWEQGVAVDVRAVLRLFIPGKSVPLPQVSPEVEQVRPKRSVPLPDLVARFVPDQKDDVILPAEVIDALQLTPLPTHWVLAGARVARSLAEGRWRSRAPMPRLWGGDR